MLVRIVRLTFHPDWADDFLNVFSESAPKIRATDGCQRLELWRDANRQAVFTTYSVWDDAEALERYRNSELFQTTWSTVKPNFSAAPEAYSYNRVKTVGE